jgi:hypothetical protein
VEYPSSSDAAAASGARASSERMILTLHLPTSRVVIHNPCACRDIV